jgi:probable rRNA maturation factor
MGVSSDALDELVIQLCGTRTVSGLNLSFRGVRGSTDVLSFPSEEHDGRGDLALDWKYVQRQAAGLGRRVEDEAALLIVHGLAHLLGHDHALPGDARRMLRWERRALRAIGVPDAPRPYGGRA